MSAVDIKDQNFQDILADGFMMRVFLLYFLQHEVQKIGQLVLFCRKIVEAEIFILELLIKGKDKAFYAEHDIFQRVGVHGFFGVFNMRIDNHQIIGAHGEEPVFY